MKSPYSSAQRRQEQPLRVNVELCMGLGDYGKMDKKENYVGPKGTRSWEEGKMMVEAERL